MTLESCHAPVVFISITTNQSSKQSEEAEPVLDPCYRRLEALATYIQFGTIPCRIVNAFIESAWFVMAVDFFLAW